MASAQGVQITTFPLFKASAVSRMPDKTSFSAFFTFHPSRRSASKKDAAEGAAVFGVFETEQAARAAAEAVKAQWPQVYVARPDRGGARVISPKWML